MLHGEIPPKGRSHCSIEFVTELALMYTRDRTTFSATSYSGELAHFHALRPAQGSALLPGVCWFGRGGWL